nr:reverse transcriptase domain-containing protein [Tanacetum cinerariifolium]
MLGEHNITYRLRTSMKGQILADFLAEMPDESLPDASVVEILQDPWTLFTDGSSCVDGSDTGLILTSPEGTKFTYALRFQFTASNNEAQYEVLIVGLRIAAQMGVRNVKTNKGQIFNIYYGLFLKVDKSKSRGDNHKQSGEKIYVGQHRMPLRSPRRDSLGRWVRGVSFRPGDFVYRSNDASHVVDGGKLCPKWEGPYKVTKALGDRAYKLRSTDRTVLQRTWNVANLKKCYL